MKLTKEIESYIIASRIKDLKMKISYLESQPYYYFIEYVSKEDRIEYEKNKLDSFIYSYNDYKKHGRFDLIEIDKHTMLNYIRMYAIEQRRIAIDFCENPYLKIKSLRNAVMAAKILIQEIPELSIYSLHWICSNVKINLAN